MKIKDNYNWMAFAALLTFCGCGDILEPDLAGFSIEIIAPSDSVTLTNGSVDFWWEENDLAEYYTIQIVSPSFENVLRIVADTNIVGDKLFFSLPPGEYAWRIKGVNSNSETAFSRRNFIVDTSSDLSGAKVVLVSPNTGTFSNTNILFEWSPLFGADMYNLLIYNSSGVLLNTYPTTQPSYNLHMDQGVFYWNVQATNNFSSSLVLNPRFLEIDSIPPSSPLLITPLDGYEASSGPQVFSWDYTQDSGSLLTDTFFLLLDSAISNPLFKVHAQGGSYTSDSLYTATYYWTVGRWDKAGNAAPITEFRKLKIN